MFTEFGLDIRSTYGCLLLQHYSRFFVLCFSFATGFVQTVIDGKINVEGESETMVVVLF
jgi:hypothetical protein